MVVLLTYIRAWIGIVTMIPFTLLCSIAAIGAGLLGSRSLGTAVMRFWSRTVLFAFGIRVECRGEHHLPNSGGGILVFNHQSHFDIPILMLTTRKHIRFGAKIELFKIPFFGGAMRAVGTLPIARENRSEVLRIYRESEPRLRDNTIFTLAPEGTRQKEPKLGRFKKGPFLFAINAQVPLIPVVIKGAHSVLPKSSLHVNVGAWSRTVQVEYLPPIPTIGMSPVNVEEILLQARNAMSVVYDRADRA